MQRQLNPRRRAPKKPSARESARGIGSKAGSFSYVSKPLIARADAFSAFFEIYSRPYRAKKKCKHFSSREKKRTFGQGAVGRAARAPSGGRLGRPGGYQRLTFGQPWVNVRSTFGHRSVMSLAISARCLVILSDSQVKRRNGSFFL